MCMMDEDVDSTYTIKINLLAKIIFWYNMYIKKEGDVECVMNLERSICPNGKIL